MKYSWRSNTDKTLRRAPRGARGLKLLVNPQDYYQKVVAPREGRVD